MSQTSFVDEVREMVNVTKKCKAPGCDGIEAELWQALDENGTKEVWQFCSVIWQCRKCPTEWRKSVLIPLHKKGASNYQTIAPIPHSSKVMLQILNNRIKVYLRR